MVKKIEKEIEVEKKKELTITEEDIVVNDQKEIKLNLGSGFRPIEGYINIDNRGCVNPDIIHDIAKDGLPFEDNSVQEVFARDFLEHCPIGTTIFVIEEIYRVLKTDGKFEFIVPSTEGLGWAQDPTHCSFWNKNSWLYYTLDDYRNLYNITAKFTGNVETFTANKQLNVIYDHGILYPVK